MKILIKIDQEVFFDVSQSSLRGHSLKLDKASRPASADRTAHGKFRLLANQWAERRLVTQWRHGCRAMRRSVCKAGASNAGPLCVHIKGTELPPANIYWYHSKGNWLRYNFAADSF